MPALTKKGARSVTSDLDRIASLFEEAFDTLGVPQKVAADFAYRCDLLSDHIEREALRLAADEETEEEGEKKTEDEGKTASAKVAEDETGLSVEPAPGNQGFDANDIGDQKSGPLEIAAPVEGWMQGHFTLENLQELREMQEAGALESAAAKHQIITKAAAQVAEDTKVRLARARRLAAVSKLSTLQDILKALQAKLEASEVASIKSLAAEIGKQVAAVGKVRDLQIEQQAVGMPDPAVLVAADRIVQILSEEVPAVQNVALVVNVDSPTALLEATKSVDSLKELVSLSSSMIADAVKSVSKGESKKEAAAKAAADDKPDFIQEKIDEKKDEKKDDEKKDEAKTASNHGYDLSA